jgi:leader peptidase (prepilin peptidase)/N-methyltransferase
MPASSPTVSGMADGYVPPWFVIAVVAAYGLVVGSFLNVVVHRLPREMSLLRPRSHCPACGALVRWFDNVPVVSFLLLRGRCRRCGGRISPRYPLVEIATAGLLVVVELRFGLTWRAVAAGVLVLLLLPLALIDLEHHLLLDWLTLPGLALGFLLALRGGLVSLRDATIGAALGAALPYVAYRLIRGIEGMGLGDVKLLAMIGAFLGWRGVLLTLCLGATAGALVGFGLIAAGRGTRDTELPFGTFLCGGAAVTLFWGNTLMHALHWIGP